ncbi:MAG: molecular chaperone DnaJ [Lachnospiraceae bacterium]
MKHEMNEKNAALEINRLNSERAEALWQEKNALEEEKREIAEQKRELERERLDFARKQEIEQQHRDQEKKLFEMKWKILESELRKVAEEKEQMENKRASFEREEEEYRSRQNRQYDRTVENVVFFKGVDNELALKKRYRDLIKIFHPDNLAGDTNTIQMINQEYDQMKRSLCI